MTDPLSLLPLALAARAGLVDRVPVQQLVAAGLTLLQRSAPLVRALAGRRAGILLPTSTTYLTALAACEGRGAVLMNPLAAAPELALQLEDATVGAVFTVGALANRLPATTTLVLLDDAPRAARVVAGGTGRDVDLGSHFPLRLEGDRDAPGNAEEAVVVYTSAMHGRPLGAILSHGNLLANARATIDAAALDGEDHVLAVLPYSQLFGLGVACISPLLAAGRVTTMSSFHPLRALDVIERRGITVLVGVPAMFRAILALCERRGVRLDAGALRVCICGGAPLDPSLEERWADATGVELRQGYGLTETSPAALFNRTDMPNVVGTVGVPCPGVRISLRDPATFDPVADGQEGEICIAGPAVFQGYVRTPDAPEPQGLEVRDGWLRSGDVGVRRPGGAIALRGVRKAMFTRNGFHIYPRELEAAIAELAGVARARVDGVPDLEHEHQIVATVEGTTSAAKVRAWCSARLSTYKQPTEIRIAG